MTLAAILNKCATVYGSREATATVAAIVRVLGTAEIELAACAPAGSSSRRGKRPKVELRWLRR
jgi:hypothetical protein